MEVGRAIRLPLVERKANSYVAVANDRKLFANATFILEVSSGLPLTDVQSQFPQSCKIGPANATMRKIINSATPGVPLVHLPNPPQNKILVFSSNVYCLLDKSTDLWREFSSAAAVGLHFAGNWPDLKLELWAIPGVRYCRTKTTRRYSASRCRPARLRLVLVSRARTVTRPPPTRMYLSW